MEMMLGARAVGPGVAVHLLFPFCPVLYLKNRDRHLTFCLLSSIFEILLLGFVCLIVCRCFLVCVSVCLSVVCLSVCV